MWSASNLPTFAGKQLSEEDYRDQPLEPVCDVHCTNITRYVKTKRNVSHNQEVNRSVGTDAHVTQRSAFADKDFR